MTIATYTPSKPPISISEKAIQYFLSQLAKDTSSLGIQLSVKKGGCSGYTYQTDFVSQEPNDTRALIFDKLTIYLDESSIPLLQGLHIDYIVENLNGIVQYQNPQATIACGCGESFNLTS